jgi:hypothetical protein
LIKTIIAAAFAALSLLAAPVPAFASVAVAVACDSTNHPGWARPGGYCDQVNSPNQLSSPGTDGGSQPCTPTVIASLDTAKRIHVATPVTCCNTATSYEFDGIAGRVHVAVNPCGGGSGCPINYTPPAHNPHNPWDRARLILAGC